MPKCTLCNEPTKSGVIRLGNVICTDCDEENRRDYADMQARNEGYYSYEDMMEDRGATIADGIDPWLTRECSY